MFDFDSYIRMLELVLCSGRDGAQDPGFFLLRSRLRFCGLLWSLHDSYTGWLRPCLSLLIAPYWMAAPIPWIQIFMYSVMDGCAHTTYIMYLRYQLYFLCRFSGGSVFSRPCSCKAFHPSLSRASWFRGHLLHNNLLPSLLSLLPRIGGLILGPVRSDISWKHLHYIPLSMYFICSADTFCKIPIKIALFPLALFHSVSLAPMGEIL